MVNLEQKIIYGSFIWGQDPSFEKVLKSHGKMLILSPLSLK